MFLLDWPEPFGLSMIEAMACGTPVLALRRGSVEEVVEDGLTIDSIEEATVALPRVMALDRRACAGDLKSTSGHAHDQRLCAVVQDINHTGECETGSEPSRASARDRCGAC
jgi:glycosyltransferase involved in cell wall biosynthesis